MTTVTAPLAPPVLSPLPFHMYAQMLMIDAVQRMNKVGVGKPMYDTLRIENGEWRMDFR